MELLASLSAIGLRKLTWNYHTSYKWMPDYDLGMWSYDNNT